MQVTTLINVSYCCHQCRIQTNHQLCMVHNLLIRHFYLGLCNKEFEVTKPTYSHQCNENLLLLITEFDPSPVDTLTDTE